MKKQSCSKILSPSGICAVMSLWVLSSLFASEPEPNFHALIPSMDMSDPLTCAKAYSIEITDSINGTDGFFPVGVLGESFERGFNVAVGGNYVCTSIRPDNKDPALAPQGVYGISIWAAIRAQTMRNLAKVCNQDGKEVRAACLFDPVVVSNIFDYAKAAVSNAVATCDERIFKWEIDNEYLPPLDYSPKAVEAFHKWLEKSYRGDIAKLNRAWKTEYASFDLAEPCRLDDYAAKPAAFMDWTRFQQETFADFLGAYYKTIYDADPKHRSVNGKDTQSSLEMQRIARTRRGNHELIGKAIAPYCKGVRGMDHYGHGDRNAYEMNFYTHTIVPNDWQPGSRKGMLYGENNNHNGPGWQFAQTIWRMIPNGLRGGTFFCNGWFGCWGDWASFSFINPDGTNREKLFYLPRFYSLIHRTERLFTQCAPVKNTPTLAILLAQRDIPFGIDDNLEPWGFPINSRLRVFSHLRNAGYHVNVITYDKLNAEYLKNIDALFLVSAEHLTDEDIGNIRNYVKNGGNLFCDTRCGAFDEHHLPREGTGLEDVLGINFLGVWESSDVSVDQGDVWFASPWGNLVRADGRVKWSPVTAQPLDPRHARFYSNKAAVFTRNDYGKGKAYWTNTQMGTIRSESANDQVPAREFFRSLLKDAGIAPSYTVVPDATCNFRAEKPVIDMLGNCMIAVSALTYEPMPASELTICLPEGLAFEKAFLCAAEENELRPIEFVRVNGGATFKLPSIKSAAWIYLLHDHAPLLGTHFEDVNRFAAPNEKTPLLNVGQTFTVMAQIVNPSAKKTFAGGTLKLNALKGWKVSAAQTVGKVKPGETIQLPFTVTVPEADCKELYPNRIYPLTVDLLDRDGKRIAVTHTVVTVDVSKKGREVLLTDNWVSRNMPWSELTGASYRHVTIPDESKGEKIIDQMWTRLGDGTEVYALQSGDRVGRRRSVKWQKLPEAAIEFDLKKVRDITRVILWEPITKDKTLVPVAVKTAYSSDGTTFGDEETTELAWGGNDVPGEADYKSRYAEIKLSKRAQYVRLTFVANKANKRKEMALDEVWIFGKGE